MIDKERVNKHQLLHIRMHYFIILMFQDAYASYIPKMQEV